MSFHSSMEKYSSPSAKVQAKVKEAAQLLSQPVSYEEVDESVLIELESALQKTLSQVRQLHERAKICRSSEQVSPDPSSKGGAMPQVSQQQRAVASLLVPLGKIWVGDPPLEIEFNDSPPWMSCVREAIVSVNDEIQQKLEFLDADGISKRLDAEANIEASIALIRDVLLGRTAGKVLVQEIPDLLQARASKR